MSEKNGKPETEFLLFCQNGFIFVKIKVMKVADNKIKSISCTDPPVLLNGWKHHQHFLTDQIRRWTTKPEQLLPLFVAKLKMLGESQFDLYTGKLTPGEIAHDITETLVGFNVFKPNAYRQWIERSNQLFWQVNISDGSEWTLRLGEDEDYYIHIHPARHSLYTTRLKGNPMRTALSTLVLAAMRKEKPSMIILNKVRTDYLGLSALTKPMSKEIFTLLNQMAELSGIKF